MKSILSGYNAKEALALEHLGDELAGVMGGGEITDTHRKSVEVLSKLMTMGTDMADESTPVPLRVLMRTLISLKPTLLEMIAKVPRSEIVRFMSGLRDDIQEIIDSAPVQDDAPYVRDAATGAVTDAAGNPVDASPIGGAAVPSGHDDVDQAAAGGVDAAGPVADLAQA